MSSAIRRYFGTAVLAAFVLVAFDARCQMTGLNATNLEIAHLPKFCWGQMGVPDAKVPEYSFPNACGCCVNHYCPGLVKLMRAKSPLSKGNTKITLLREAEKDIRYTKTAVKDLHGCPIREHVEATNTEVQNLLKIYGANRSRGK